MFSVKSCGTRGVVWVKFVGWVRQLSEHWREFATKGAAVVMERLANCSDEVTVDRTNFKAEEERAERVGWFVNN